MHNIRIPRYENLVCSELGHDSPKHAGRRFFDHEPVEYEFNAWGFRTHSFDKLNSNSILVFGDSYTLGLGENINNCYTSVMEQQLGCPVFNISLNGASNDWIARRVQNMLSQVQPRAVVVHYTFTHRRELDNASWYDDERTLCEPTHTSAENFDNWQQNFNKIVSAVGQQPLIHSFIPKWHDVKVDYSNMPGTVLLPLEPLDRARDGFHYGVKTHQLLGQQLTNLLAF
jgi:hypothetical protein